MSAANHARPAPTPMFWAAARGVSSTAGRAARVVTTATQRTWVKSARITTAARLTIAVAVAGDATRLMTAVTARHREQVLAAERREFARQVTAAIRRHAGLDYPVPLQPSRAELARRTGERAGAAAALAIIRQAGEPQ